MELLGLTCEGELRQLEVAADQGYDREKKSTTHTSREILKYISVSGRGKYTTRGASAQGRKKWLKT